MFKKLDKEIFIYIGLAVYYILAFMMVLKSGFFYDDLTNYTVNGWCINNDQSIFQLTKIFALQWYHGAGRCFIFGFYLYFLFSLVTLQTYKFLIIAATFANGLCLSGILFRLTGEKKLKYLILLLFPTIVSLDCTYFNPMFGFHMLLQICFMWVLLAVYFFVLYEQSKKKLYQIISFLCLFIALGTYEVSFVLCLIFPVIALTYNKKIKNAFLAIVPQILTGLFWLAMNIIAKVNATGAYSGTSIKLGKDCFIAFFKQLSGSIAAGNIDFLVTWSKYNNIYSYLAENKYMYLILGLCLISGLFFILKDNKPYEKKYTSIIIGVMIILLPCILISISERYQTEIRWGNGYLPAYISSWGIAVLFALLFTMIKKRFMKILVITLTVCMMLINQMIGGISSAKANSGMPSVNNFVDETVSAGLFDDYNNKEYVIEANGCWATPNDHFAYLLKHKTKFVNWGELFAQKEDGEITYGTIYNELKNKEYYYSAFSKDQFYLFAHCSNLLIDKNEDGNINKVVNSYSFDLYIPSCSSMSSIAYTDSNGQNQTVNIRSCEQIRISETGAIYRIVSEQEIDVTKISIY